MSEDTMPTILPPNCFDSGEHSALPPDEAAASPSSPDAAVGIPEPTSSTGGPQGSPAPGQELCGAGDLDCIGEIFVGAAKLEPVEMWFENTAYPREDELLYEVLQAMDDPRAPHLRDIPDGLWAEFDPPLFLRQA
jgi:hypothetical protein